MGDRDIPSVPVTTLAGLTSPSDLLSELPVSDSLQNAAPLNKSLLFHTLVANESNNLLSVRDENLVRQLVHAIEQTNSDNIELKPQYAIQQHGTNISTYPELLQGIYNFRPTVFNTPQKTAAANIQAQQLQYQMQRNSAPNIVSQQNAYPETTIHNSQNFNAHPPQQQFDAPQQQHSMLMPQQNVNNVTPVNQTIIDNQEPVTRRSRRHMEQVQDQQFDQQAEYQRNLQNQHLLQQQQLQQLHHHNQQNLQEQHTIQIAQQTSVIQQPQQQQYHHQQSPQHQPQQQLLQKTSVIQPQQLSYNSQQQQLQQQQLQPEQQQQIESTVILLNQNATMTHNQASNMLQHQPPPPIQPHQQPPQKHQFEQPSLIHPEHPQNSPIQQASTPSTTTTSIQGNFQNVLNLQRQQLAQQRQQLQQQQQQQLHHQQLPPSLNKNPSNQSPAQAAIAPEAPHNHQNHQQQFASTLTPTPPTSSATTFNHNNVNAMPGSASCSGDVIANDLVTNATTVSATASSSNSTSSGKSQIRVCINRLNAEDARLMQQSIKEFVQKSPEIANKMGLLQQQQDGAAAQLQNSISNQNCTNTQQTQIGAASSGTTTTTTTTGTIDMFTMIKGDEKRSGVKRKVPFSIDDIPPEQIYSKPKVRRVERIQTTPNAKYSKEEVTRSQTYQQFMRNMEQIIELLDDTESPNFESDDIDENIECISPKMLNTMSNDVAKLKAKQALDSIPKNKLTLLINYAMRNVYLAKNYSAGPEDEDDIVDDEVIEKILNAMEACLLICNIYSTVNDLKFLQEDNISMIIKFVQFQFRETIFPLYDPVYTVKSMKKTDNRKKAKSHQSHHRSLQLFFSKAVELMKVFVTLFDKCIFVDTIVLPLSTVAIEPFFVDNIETLQFVCLELVTTIFRKERYDKIRSSILGDILSSIDRLPSSKKNLRPYKLTNNSGNIQMVTALVLQLIQCATILPDSLCDNGKNSAKAVAQQIIDLDDEIPGGAAKVGKPNHDVVVLKKYDVAISIGGNFLTTFLNKCKTRSNETDFRPLFENFIHDLLATVNKPEWPASELLLSLLGTMLVRYVSDKGIEQSIRLVSLDYLGIVAARLRKDTVESRCKVHIIDSMIKSIKAEQEKEGDLPIVNSKIELGEDEQRTEFLQKILLDFLAVNAQEENLIWDYARHFCLAQWYRDTIYQRRRIKDGEKGFASRKKNMGRKKRKHADSSYLSNTSSSDENDSHDQKASGSNRRITDQELNLEIFNVLEERKQYLLNKIKPYSSANEHNHTSHQHIKTYIDYNNAHLITQYLATKRPFSQSFDGYLKKIILVVNEPSIAVRTRAMKCLANIVEVDPLVLKRKDMQIGVNQKFLDAAISVREAAVDLVGKFVLSSEELIDQYYDMLSTRILDTGVSVRKRVIKILRDICIEYPDFLKIPEICVKMIRRVHDEEGIQKLVTEVFMKMWFNPCVKNDKHGVQRKINQIIDVVNTAHDTGTTWLEGLLTSIFQPKENNVKMDGTAQEPVKKNTEPPAEIVLACQQLADGLVDRLIELEDTDNARMLGCITTLHLLAKVRPQLLVRHAITIEPYLNIKCQSATAPKFICAVADILEKVVPLVNNASESFLASLEEHLMLLVVSRNQAEVTSCVSCLGAVVNKITKNYKLIRDCFQKFYRVLDGSRNQVVQNNYSIDNIYTPMFRRSLFTIGILMRYFDFKSAQVLGETNSLSLTICDEAFECLMFFCICSNQEIRKQALIALGSFCVMNDDYLTRSELKQYYCDQLRSNSNEASVKIICMRNIWIYLTESEMFMHNKEKEWEKQSKNEDLKEMNDVSSGMASRIIQLYLEEVLNCFLNRDDAVRLWAVKVVQIVLRQGLVHPVRMVPYLICLSTDCKLESAHRADALLKDIDKTYSGFVNMKVQFGLQLCFKLQEVLQSNSRIKNDVIRGYVKRESDQMPTALNDFLYTLLRTTKPQRRALVQTVTKQFDDQKTSLRQMLYIADNLAYFPYVVQDEPLYLIHQIDLHISMAGTNLLATYKECMKPNENASDILEDDDDEEDPQVLFKRLPDDTTEIQKCITSAQACMLLLILKEHLKDMYGLTDGKISRYSPSEQKIYEKAVPRKTVQDFNPKSTIEVIRKQQEQNLTNVDGELAPRQLTDEEKLDLVIKYLDFKQLMLKLDPEDADSDAEDKSKLNNSTLSDQQLTPTTSVLNSTGANQTFNDSNNSGVVGGVDANNTSMNSTGAFNNFGIHHPNALMTPPTQVREAPTTPTSRNSKTTPQSATKQLSNRKQPTRSRRKKRKLLSSDDEDDDYSDEDYA